MKGISSGTETRTAGEDPSFGHPHGEGPSDPDGLKSHRANPARFQPLRHPVQIRRPRSELLHRTLVAPRWHAGEMTCVADVYARGIGMHDFQLRIAGFQLLLQLSPFTPIQPSPLLQTFKS